MKAFKTDTTDNSITEVEVTRWHKDYVFVAFRKGNSEGFVTSVRTRVVDGPVSYHHTKAEAIQFLGKILEDACVAAEAKLRECDDAFHEFERAYVGSEAEEE